MSGWVGVNLWLMQVRTAVNKSRLLAAIVRGDFRARLIQVEWRE